MSPKRRGNEGQPRLREDIAGFFFDEYTDKVSMIGHLVRRTRAHDSMIMSKDGDALEGMSQGVRAPEGCGAA